MKFWVRYRTPASRKFVFAGPYAQRFEAELNRDDIQQFMGVYDVSITTKGPRAK